MQPNLFPFGTALGNLFGGGDDDGGEFLSPGGGGGFDSSRVLFLLPLLLFQGEGMDLSRVGEKILSSVKSATSLGLIPSASVPDRPEKLVRRAGKKVYTLAMGRPNAAKLANFPECDVFIYVSCAQTALLDSKEFLAPVITPFEAMLAFTRGSQWTGDYVMEFRDLINSSSNEVENTPESEEARFSFLKGGYVEDRHPPGDVEDESDQALALASTMQKALQLRDAVPNALIKGTTAKSSAEYFAARSYRGLDINSHNSSPETFMVGRSGRAAGYDDEKH